MTPLEQRAINVIRGLAMDAPHAAHSGHQGTAMALAPLAHVLWTRIMRYDPTAPDWPDRDRFVLSAGHASILLYSMLHLTGYDLSLDDLRQFRQWGSRTPGHPEARHTPGVEVTTGPLGAGFGNAVGLGIAEEWLRARFGPDVCDHQTFVICSDGDLSEGVSHESASLAGHLGLGRLVFIYDDNHISIDGPTELALSDDTARRFEGYGWHVCPLGESGEDLEAIEDGLRAAIELDDAPSLVILRTHIAYPSPDLTDSPKAHGLALGEAEIRRTKEVMGLPPDESFWVPADVAEYYADAGRRAARPRVEWTRRIAAYDGDREVLDACLEGRGLTGWESKLPVWSPGESLATREATEAALRAAVEVVPGIVAGGADLTGNTGVALEGPPLSADARGARQLYFGVREHGMGSIMNGLALHGGLIPFGGTFLIFSDYMRPAVRLAALSQAHSVFVWSHDSVGLGEDGPTHQPVEHLAALRAIPGLRVFRPADANETARAVRLAIELTGPSALVTSRQKLPVLDGTATGDVERGAYALVPGGDHCELVLVGTGSEVSLCVDAASELAAAGHDVRVVSMPCWELFEAQDRNYRDSVLPPGLPVLSVEAATTFGWSRWADDNIGIDRFGASAPGDRVLTELGINPENVVERAGTLIRSGEGAGGGVG